MSTYEFARPHPIAIGIQRDVCSNRFETDCTQYFFNTLLYLLEFYLCEGQCVDRRRRRRIDQLRVKIKD